MVINKKRTKRSYKIMVPNQNCQRTKVCASNAEPGFTKRLKQVIHRPLEKYCSFCDNKTSLYGFCFAGTRKLRKIEDLRAERFS